MSKNRSFCFTINNPTDDDVYKLCYCGCEIFKYLCFGFEVGEKGTPHIQGYIQLKNPRTLKSVAASVQRAHVEVAKGTPKQNIEYCSKDGDFHEFGDRPTQGGAMTWERVEEAFSNPEGDAHICNQYTRYYEMMREKMIVDVERKTEFFVLDGDVDDDFIDVHPIDKFNYFLMENNIDLDDAVVCSDMSECAVHKDPLAILYIGYSGLQNQNEYQKWLRGYPIRYKYGYQYRTVKPKYFVVHIPNGWRPIKGYKDLPIKSNDIVELYDGLSAEKTTKV